MTHSEIVIDYRYGGLNPVEFGHEKCEPAHAYGPAVRTYWLLLSGGFNETLVLYMGGIYDQRSFAGVLNTAGDLEPGCRRYLSGDVGMQRNGGWPKCIFIELPVEIAGSAFGKGEAERGICGKGAELYALRVFPRDYHTGDRGSSGVGSQLFFQCVCKTDGQFPQ